MESCSAWHSIDVILCRMGGIQLKIWKRKYFLMLLFIFFISWNYISHNLKHFFTTFIFLWVILTFLLKWPKLYRLNQLIQFEPQVELLVEKWHELHCLQSLDTTEIWKIILVRQIFQNIKCLNMYVNSGHLSTNYLNLCKKSSPVGLVLEFEI